MIINLDVSKLEIDTIRGIAAETDDVIVLGKLVNIDNASVIEAIIQNPATTKSIRKSIYSLWKNKSAKRRIVLQLIDYPLDADTISEMLKNEAFKSEHICTKLIEQEDICQNDLEIIYAEVTAPNGNTEFANSVLCTMAHRTDLSEGMANKLVAYSPKIAAIIAETYSRFLRVDFSKGQTQ